MRLYLNEKDFVKSEAAGREILPLGYSLVSDYSSLFKEATEKNTETINESYMKISQGLLPLLQIVLLNISQREVTPLTFLLNALLYFANEFSYIR